MFCDNCGNEIPDNSTFCPECGIPVANGVQQETVSNEPADNVVNTMPLPEMPAEVKEKSKKPLIIVLALVIILGVGAFGAKAYMEKRIEAEESAYKEMMTDFGKDLEDGIYNNTMFILDLDGVYKNWIDLLRMLGANDSKSNSNYGNMLFTGGDGYDNTEFLNNYNNDVADLNSEAQELSNNFAKLSDPPKKYEEIYNQIKLIYDEYVEYNRLAVDKTTVTSNSYNNFTDLFIKKTDDLVSKIDTIEELIASMEDEHIIENLETAKLAYNEIGVLAVNYKVETGNFPNDDKIVEKLNTADAPIVEIPKGVTVAVSYSQSTGTVNSVWVCSSENGITGTESDEYLACYDPDIDGNAADTANFSYNIICINGGDWQVKQ